MNASERIIPDKQVIHLSSMRLCTTMLLLQMRYHRGVLHASADSTTAINNERLARGAALHAVYGGGEQRARLRSP